MATPDFVAQNDSNFTPIRFYTAQDPYFYTVDNRPLQDIESNLKANRSGGSDAGRRAALLGSLNLAAVLADLYAIPSESAAVRGMSGLEVTVPSTNLVRVSAGAVYEKRAVSTSISDVVMKMALCTKSTDFNLTAPVTVGTSVIYTVEGAFVELVDANLSSTQLPNLDSTNTFLASTLTHGELRLTLNAGIAATTGTQVAPATSPGKFPIYNIVLTQGTTAPHIEAHANAPYIKGLYQGSTPVALTTGGATLGVTSEMPSATFADAAITGVMLPITSSIKNLNPFLPIKVKLTFVSTAATGNFVTRLRYASFKTSDVIAVASATTNNDVVAVTGAANALQTFTTINAVVPNSAFAGLNGTSWTVLDDKINVVFERVGNHASDTNTGSMVLLQAILFQ